MTVKDDGAFEGVVRLEDEERPFRGAISVLGPHAMRYDGTFGDGIATVAAERGRLTLKLVPDGGGGVATFLPAQPESTAENQQMPKSGSDSAAHDQCYQPPAGGRALARRNG